MPRLSPSNLEYIHKDCGIESAILSHKSVEADTSQHSLPASDIYPTAGGAQLLDQIIRKQLQLQGRTFSNNPNDPAIASQMDDNENEGEEDNTSSRLPTQRPGWVLLEHCKNHWNWNDFFYNLILDLAPATWDIITDLIFAKFLETKDIHLAGLSYMFICLPIVWLVVEQVDEIKISKIKMTLYVITFPTAATLITWGLWVDPLLFRLPAILSSIIFLGLKSVAVFVHSPKMAEFSLHMSQVENVTEGPLQILLILLYWLSGGPLFLDTLLSSLLDIGKVGAENFLTASPKNLLKGKPFFKKLVLVIQYLPVFLLTPLFRVGSGAVALINYSQGFSLPFSTAFAMFLTWVCIAIQNSLCQLWFVLLRVHVLPELQQMDFSELGHAVGSEFTGMTIWGKLGRRGSRAPQIIMSTWFLLHNLVHISLVFESTFTQVKGDQANSNLWCNYQKPVQVYVSK